MRTGLYGIFGATAALAGDGSITYSNGQLLAEAIKCTHAPDIVEGEYSTNNKTRKVRKMRGGNVSLETDTLSFEVRALLFGHSNDAEAAELTITGADVPSPVGITYYSEDTDGKWYGALIRYCTFAPPSLEDSTYGGSMTFGSTSLSGYAELTGDGLAYAVEKQFETEAAALAWCKTQLGISTT